MKNLPSKHYLVMDFPLKESLDGIYIQTVSTKCSCDTNRGQWVVEWDQRFYPFIHANNLQKDIWLTAVKTDKAKEARIKMLRWFCHTCGNVQMP